MTRKVFNYGGGMHSPTALTAFLRDALDGDVADGMKVVAGSGMNVTVQAGTARVGRDPSYDINVTGTESVDVGAASPSNPMSAVIVAYVDRNVAGSTSVTDNTNNVFKLKAVSGAAAASPSDPSSSVIQSAIGAANPYIILARVRKRAGATSVVASDITDLRVMVTLKAGRISSSSILADNVIKSGHLSDGIVLPRHISQNLTSSGSEMETSETFDGKRVYARYYNFSFSSIGSSSTDRDLTGILNSYTILSFSGFLRDGENYKNISLLPQMWGDQARLQLYINQTANGSSGQTFIRCRSPITQTNVKLTITVKYTKS